MENLIEELNSESLDSYITRYKDTLEDCMRSFKIQTIPGIKEEYYDLSDIDKECNEYLKSHTELALKLTLDTMIEIMEEDDIYDSYTENRPVFLKGETTFAYFVYVYLEKKFLVRKFMPDDAYSIVKEKMKNLCLRYGENLEFFTDGRTNESEFQISELKKLEAEENESEYEDKDNPYSEIDRLCAEDEAAYASMYEDPTYGMGYEEQEDYELVRKASKLGVMPCELLPLKDEYRNMPFSQWDIKPILPVIDYNPKFNVPYGEDEYEFDGYGLRDGDILAEMYYADYFNSESFSLDWYKETSNPYTNKLLHAMILGRKSMEEFDFQKYLKKMDEYRAEQKQLLEETRKEYIDDDNESGFTDYVNDIRESINDFPCEDDMYICVVNDIEFKEYARRKFQQEKDIDIEHFIDWNRKYVYPKILETL